MRLEAARREVAERDEQLAMDNSKLAEAMRRIAENCGKD